MCAYGAMPSSTPRHRARHRPVFCSFLLDVLHELTRITREHLDITVACVVDPHARSVWCGNRDDASITLSLHIRPTYPSSTCPEHVLPPWRLPYWRMRHMHSRFVDPWRPSRTTRTCPVPARRLGTAPGGHHRSAGLSTGLDTGCSSTCEHGSP